MKPEVKIKATTGPELMRDACAATLRPGMNSSKVSLFKLYRCEHSPIRAIKFWLELIGVPTFVSVHLVRHKHGVEHFVMSNRDDRGGAGDEQVNRLTPVKHSMDINAQALIQMSRKRLCFMSHQKTVAWWNRVRKAVRTVDPVLADFMVPECCVRGYCPEMRECGPGVRKVLRAYAGNPHCAAREKLNAESE